MGEEGAHGPGLPAMKVRDQAGCLGEEASPASTWGEGQVESGSPCRVREALALCMSPSTWGRPDPVEGGISAGRW